MFSKTKKYSPIQPIHTMKTRNVILATALGLASTAFADPLNPTIVRLCGSTAFRSAIHTNILAVMTGETYAYTGATLADAQQANFVGVIAGEDVIVKCSWSGSVEGIQALDQPATINTLFLANSVVGTSGGTPNVTPGTSNEEAEIGMSDVFQGSTVFQSTELIDTQVAVVPFKVLAGKGAPASLTNVTNLSLQALYTAGKVPLALVTGNNADRTAKLFAMGRNNLSGTRLTTLADTGLGALATVVQYTFNGTAYTNVGNGGYSSGGNTGVRGALAQTSTFATGYNVAYIGLSDASGAITSGAKELTYNGVLYSPTAVREGSYTLWGYQHLFTRDDIGTVEGAVATAIANETILNPGTAGLTQASMGVLRLSEGAPIGNTYPTP